MIVNAFAAEPADNPAPLLAYKIIDNGLLLERSYILAEPTFPLTSTELTSYFTSPLASNAYLYPVMGAPRIPGTVKLTLANELLVVIVVITGGRGGLYNMYMGLAIEAGDNQAALFAYRVRLSETSF